jgi:predicted CoA-binding protein
MPNAIAVIGASSNPKKYGNIALKAWRETPWTVYAVNTREEEIEGMPAYDSILDIPGEVNFATLYVPPRVGSEVADELIEKGVEAVYLNPGTESPELRKKLEDAGIEVIEACSIIASRQFR